MRVFFFFQFSMLKDGANLKEKFKGGQNYYFEGTNI
jgi:hypothetical protein